MFFDLKGWGMYAQLLIDLFKFLAPFLRNAELAKPVTLLYKGTLRVLLVLLHDFPEFLCDYHYGFCDVIPPNCIQVCDHSERMTCVFISVNFFDEIK
jgi:CCR4-NOT transcription complex subunit 1